MINIENKVYDTVRTALFNQLGTVYTDLMTYSDYPMELPKFPSVTIVEISNITYTRGQDEHLSDNYGEVTYQIDVYMNGQNRKTIARQVLECADAAMLGMKFTRTMMAQTPNADRNIYRHTARYTAVVKAGETSGDDTVYQMYRR